MQWYLAYPLDYRNLKEMIAERGVMVDHTSLYCWVLKFTLLMEACFRRGKKQPVGLSWRMDDTTIKFKGQWKYLYRAVDKAGQPVDFFLTAICDKKAALRLLKQAIRQHGRPTKVTIDQSGANTAALIALDSDTDPKITIHQRKYLNNLIKQDHRAVKRLIRPMLGFQTFRSARITLQGIELMHMIKKGQMQNLQSLSAADPFYSLAA